MEIQKTSEEMTYGLSDKWIPYLSWARENSVLDALLLIVDACLIHDKHYIFATLADRLNSEHVITVLSRWASSSPYANYLYVLARALRDNPPDFAERELPSQKPARLQLHGDLRKLYVIAAIIERVPLENEDPLWFEKFRAWALIHAMRAAAHQNYQDEYLREIFKYIRISADKLGKKLVILNELKANSRRFDEFNKELELNAARLLRTDGLAQVDTDFLENLIRVARGKSKKENTSVQVTPAFPLIKVGQPPIDVGKAPINLFPDAPDFYEEEDGAIEIEALEADEEGDDRGLGIGVDPTQSSEKQRLSTGSVLLMNVEDLQFLPWSWSRPNPNEVQVLMREIESLLHSPDEKERLLGALLWIARCAGRSLRRVLEIGIGEKGEEWALDRTCGRLCRTPPLHRNSWVPDTEVEKNWVHAAYLENEILLPVNVAAILCSRLQKIGTPNSLWQLWDYKEYGSPGSWFKRVMEPSLPRLSPGMLANVLPQTIYESTGNDKLSRLMSSHPLSGLPPASAYSSWTAIDNNEVAALVPGPETAEPDRIVIGARLYPIEQLLVAAIKEATEKLTNARQHGNLVEFHNLLTAYLGTMLLAATGGRPVADPFESPEYFDLEAGFVYIEDKTTIQGGRGRLVPLPEKLCAYIGVEYKRHLRIVATQVGISNAQLGKEIDRLADGKRSETLPYLFFLEPENPRGWKSVSASGIGALELFHWPLPPNLFRHRLARLLPRYGVDQEIVDGILGHVEHGCESYGDFSPRNWLEDAKRARVAIRKAFDGLGFELMPHQPMLVACRQNFFGDISNHAFSYGARARALKRKKRVRDAVYGAKWDIVTFVGDKSLDQLTEVEVDQLSRHMLFHSSGLPRRDGLLRYGHLLRRIQLIWKKQGKRVRLGKRYIFPEVISPFTDLAPGSLGKFERIRTMLEQAAKEKPVSRLSKQEKALLAALFLATENRLSDVKQLERVLDGTHYRVVMFRGRHYVELGTKREIEGGNAPVRRLPISIRCAYLLTESRKTFDEGGGARKAIPKVFAPLAEFLCESQGDTCPTCQTFLNALVLIVDQANVVSLPGILAGYLAGRVSSWSLGWNDWLRLELGSRLRLKGEENKNQANFETFTNSEVVYTLNHESGAETFSQRNAELFFKGLRAILAEEFDQSEEDDKPTRELISKRINVLLRDYKGKVSTTVQLVCLWIQNLVEAKRSSKDFYAISTIERYLNALSPRVEVLGYDLDLLAMEDEEVTEFYQQLLDIFKDNDQAYLGQRLLAFHAWARARGVEEPDWEELEIPLASVHANPGVITEGDYQNALVLLLKSGVQSEMEGRWLAMFLMLVYRFGLRGKEALGLTRQDIQFLEGQYVVLVRDNWIRKLKNRGSRRQVPLIFKLGVSEKRLLQTCLDSLDSMPGYKQSDPIFRLNEVKLNRSQMKAFKSRVLEVLKMVTGNQHTVIHHARHTAVNRLAHHVLGLRLATWKGHHLSSPEHSRCMLVGRAGHTRRMPWATARFLGHSNRTTQFRSYIHFVGEWAGQYHQPLSLPVKEWPLGEAIDIEKLIEPLAEIKTGLLDKTKQQPHTPSVVDYVQLFKLVANGKSDDYVANVLSIDPLHVQKSVEILQAITRKNTRFDTAHFGDKALLQKINKNTWQRFYALAKDRSKIMQDYNLPGDLRDLASSEFVYDMMGQRGQILMWKPVHFRLMQAMLGFFGIPPDFYEVVKSFRADKSYDRLLEDHGFKLTLPQHDSESNKATFQIDAAYDTQESTLRSERCALIFKRQSTGSVRNTVQFAFLFVLFLSWINSCSTEVD